MSQNRDDSVSGAKYVSKRFAADLARSCSDMLKQAETSYLTSALARDEEEAKLREQQEQVRRMKNAFSISHPFVYNTIFLHRN